MLERHQPKGEIRSFDSCQILLQRGCQTKKRPGWRASLAKTVRKGFQLAFVRAIATTTVKLALLAEPLFGSLDLCWERRLLSGGCHCFVTARLLQMTQEAAITTLPMLASAFVCDLRHCHSWHSKKASLTALLPFRRLLG